MPRNFGVRRNRFGEEMFRDYWNEGEPERDARWPFYVIGAAVLFLVGIGIFIA